MMADPAAGGASINWAFPVLCGALLASAVLLRRRPLMALAVTLGGYVATVALPLMPVRPMQIVLVGAAGIEIFYMAVTRTWRVSVTGVAMVGAALPYPGPEGFDLAELRGGAALITIIAWLIGNSMRQAQARAELVRAQAAAQVAMAERLRPGAAPG